MCGAPIERPRSTDALVGPHHKQPTYPQSPQAPKTGPSDKTTWRFHQPTGLLNHKEYADGKGPTYTYRPDGQLHTRTWARPDANGQPITTTYLYHPDTGQLTDIETSDNTPNITCLRCDEGPNALSRGGR